MPWFQSLQSGSLTHCSTISEKDMDSAAISSSPSTKRTNQHENEKVCEVDWQPVEGPQLPEPGCSTIVDNVPHYPKARGEIFRFGSMYFAVVSNARENSPSKDEVLKMFKELFDPVRPSNPCVCWKCNAPFYNIAMFLRHVSIQGKCHLDSGGMYNNCGPSFFVLTPETCSGLAEWKNDLSSRGVKLPVNLLDPFSNPTLTLKASCGKCWFKNEALLLERRRELNSFENSKSFKAVVERKLNRARHLIAEAKRPEEVISRFKFYPFLLSLPFLKDLCHWPPEILDTPEKVHTKGVSRQKELEEWKATICDEIHKVKTQGVCAIFQVAEQFTDENL